MSFLFPSLLWIGLPLAAVPILIHLLNLRRQRRVEWAAMDFLLQSEQRNRTWVNLRQWLLLAARIGVVLLIALMVARPRLRSDLAAWFTAERVHHVIVLDDSYSMSDRGPRAAVWDDALSAVGHIITAAEAHADHQVSVLRSSQCLATPSAEPITASGRAELTTLAKRIEGWEPSETAADLGPAIATAAGFAEAQQGRGTVVAYVISDFREKNIEPAEQILDAVAELRSASTAVHLAPCSTARQENLAITALRLLPGPRTAGVELTAEVTVANFSRRPIDRVTVRLKRDGQPLPAGEISEIPPRGEASCTFPVRFEAPGDHWLAAEIDADAVAADNQRWLAATLPAEREVLIVDGSPGGAEGIAYATALRPRGGERAINTGWAPRRVSPAEFEQLPSLDAFAAVLLLDVPRVSASAANRLDKHAAGGGGVFVSLGQSVDRRNYNRVLFGVASDALPRIRLDLPTQTPPAAGDQAGLVVTDHPLLKVYAGDRNSFLSLVRVDYYFGMLKNRGREAVGTRTIASLPGGAPLLVEGATGPGRLVCLLTTVARPRGAVEGWSNLGVSPVFPVFVNELAGYLAAPRLLDPAPVVGRAWGEYAITGSTEPPAAIQPLEPSTLVAMDSADAPLHRGLYRALPANPQASPKLLAANVDPGEGDLQAVDADELRSRLAGPGVSVTSLADFLRTTQDASQASIYRWLGVGALALLLLEQLLAVLGSYHQPFPSRGPA